MSRVVELLCSRRMPHVAVLALMSIGFAGCSADMSTRFSQNIPLQSLRQPSHSDGSATTGSVPTPRSRAPRTSAIFPAATTQYQSQALPPPISAPQSYPTASAGRRVRRRARARFLFAAAGPSAAGDHRQRRAAFGRGDPRSGTGGTTIIVGTSDTLETLARRYNVSPAAILQANGYKGPRALSPGQQLIIPHQATAAVAAPALAAPVSKPVAVASAPRHRFMSSITAIRCSASPAATTCRWRNSPRPTISIPRPSSSSA